MISLVPSVELSSLAGGDVEILSLIHPRTNTFCDFLCLSNNGVFSSLFEIQKVNRGPISNGSFLLDSSLFHTTSITIHTKFDPFFILLEGLLTAAPASGSFIDFIDAMNLIISKVSSSQGLVRLIQLLSKHPRFKSQMVTLFCDERTVCDRLLLRINNDKVSEFLKNKLAAIEAFIDENNVYLSERNSSIPTSCIAMELLRSYIPESLFAQLSTDLNIDTSGMYGGETNEKEDEKKEAKRRAIVQAPKKSKELAVAKSCMKMTAFFKPK